VKSVAALVAIVLHSGIVSLSVQRIALMPSRLVSSFCQRWLKVQWFPLRASVHEKMQKGHNGKLSAPIPD
jgi:hypothetical protein